PSQIAAFRIHRFNWGICPTLLVMQWVSRREVDSDMDLGIAGKVALVTGAGGGLGRAIAIALASEQCTVVPTDVALAAAQETAALCSMLGRNQDAVQLDVSDARSIESAIDAIVRQHGRLDILI